jgi:hypothetical protein
MSVSVTKLQLRLSALLAALFFAGCATEPLTNEHYVKGTPQPDRWQKVLAAAKKGQIEEVPDEPESSPTTVHWIDIQFAPVGKTARTKPSVGPDIFNGSFRLEAKTSYAKAHKEKTTMIEPLLNKLASDAEMSQQHHELVAKDANHQNHQPRITEEKRNVTLKAWLYWVKKQSDNDYHLILGDTSEFSSGTLFMNAEISGLPPEHPTQQPFVKLRSTIQQLLSTRENVKGFFVQPVLVRIGGSLLWDGEHRNPHNVGPKKPEDLRPKKAWEIHPIHDFRAAKA